MSSSWTNKVEHVSDGEKVEAKVDSRPTRALESQSNYLKDRIDGIENKEALVSYNAAIEPDASYAMAVYWNGTRSRFERALASYEFNTETSTLETSPMSEVIGIVIFKHSPEVADILIFGKGEVDLTAVLDTAIGLTAGRYYLSGKVKGKLSKSPAIADVAVLHSDGAGIVYVQPQLRDGPYNHVHYEFSLYLEPCGNSAIPAPGGRHSIINTNDELQGWLPADDASFNGLAPPKAAFGYNLKTHTALYNVFPPMPAESASVTLFKSETDGNGVDLPMGVAGLISVDINGIWWMSDCYGDVPWAYKANYSSISESGPECTREVIRLMLLRFAKSSYGVEKTVVTSLEPIENSGIVVLGCYDNKPAKTGPLKIGINLSLAVTTTPELGSLVVKTAEGIGLKRGRVIEGIIAADSSIRITSTVSRLEGSATLHQGIVTIGKPKDPAETIIQPQVVRLSDAKERYYEDIMYIAFPPLQASSIRLKVMLPYNPPEAPTWTTLKMRLRLLGRVSGTLPRLTISYRVLRRAIVFAASLPLDDTILGINTDESLTTANQYIDIDSADITGVLGQDIIYFTISRGAGADFAGEVGLIDAVAVLYRPV